MATTETWHTEHESPAASHATAPPRYTDQKSHQLARLHRIDGQVRRLIHMINNDRDCLDVLTQISAATRGLQEVVLGLVDDHSRHRVLDAARADNGTGDVILAELTDSLRRALRL